MYASAASVIVEVSLYYSMYIIHGKLIVKRPFIVEVIHTLLFIVFCCLLTRWTLKYMHKYTFKFKFKAQGAH